MTTQTLPIAKIQANPNQPRKHFDADALAELADSIRSVGLLNPILVRPVGEHFEIVHGERRWRAAQLAGLESIKAEVKELDDKTAFLVSLSENLQRNDLNPIEEADSLRRLIDDFGYTQSGAGRVIGKSQPWVAARLSLLKLPEPIQEKVITRVITPSAARELARIEDADLQTDLAEKAASGNLTVRELEAVQSSPDGEWPPPRVPPSPGSFFDTYKWAKRWQTYLDSAQLATYQDIRKRALIQLYLCGAAGNLLNRIQERFGKEDMQRICQKMGRFAHWLSCMLIDMRLKITDGELSEVLTPPTDAEPWAVPILQQLNASEACDWAADMTYILAWHHGWNIDGGISGRELAEAVESEREHIEPAALNIPPGTTDRAWAELVMRKYEERGLRLSPTGIAQWPEPFTFDEWEEALRALTILGKYGGSEEDKRLFANAHAPADFAVISNGGAT